MLRAAKITHYLNTTYQISKFSHLIRMANYQQHNTKITTAQTCPSAHLPMFPHPFRSSKWSNSPQTTHNWPIPFVPTTSPFIWTKLSHPEDRAATFLQNTGAFNHHMQWRTEGGFQPPTPKFWSFAKAETNSQFRGIYICNKLIRIWVSFICKLSGISD
jgi:hypothetical protein